MTAFQDGPASSKFTPLALNGNLTLAEAANISGMTAEMRASLESAPHGACVSWGIPFEVGKVIAIHDQPVTIEIEPLTSPWLVFLHTSDIRVLEKNSSGFISPMRGRGQLNEAAAEYIVRYADGMEETAVIRRRHEVSAFKRHWGENAFEAVAHHKPFSMRTATEQRHHNEWGASQTRVNPADEGPWTNWLWAWKNPHPEKKISGFRFAPLSGLVILSAITAGDVSGIPLRWEPRRKACLKLPQGVAFQPDMDENGLLQHIQLDMGQVISATRRPLYPTDKWPDSFNNQFPEVSPNEVLIEYTCHPEACFHLNGQIVPVSRLGDATAEAAIRPVVAAGQVVHLRVNEKGGRQSVPVKLHVHGESGEYLAPMDRHRIPNPAWFEDYSVDFVHQNWKQPGGSHTCTYIPGETTLKLPQGKVYIEVSKGFEIRPVRKVVEVTPATEEILIEVEKVLPWREKGWVTADTHVHFLSPISALLEGTAEGVNVVNLLASQWGELMTNVGDFDGQTTWGSKEAGGSGEYLVRVGTENRQHVMGHISLLGYHGPIIAPMTTGGPDESALGDPIEVLLTEWARQCRKQGGLVVLPHFPNPRAEHAASIVSGDIDALEMTSWGNLHGGIDPYSLSDWYRYLNCGYHVPAVGGTDKMSADTAVGTVRTYAHLDSPASFSYEAWKDAVRKGETFVTYGPLLDFMVDGRAMGSRLQMSSKGGKLDVTWQVASVTIPITRVELVVNGEVRETQSVPAAGASGSWTVKVDKSCWLALLVRGQYPDLPEIVAAHSSPVMVQVEGSPMLPAADAVTILEQIEGSLAYLDTVGTRAEDRVYKRMRLVLESAHRTLHNRMHQQGYFHDHTSTEDHH